MDLRIDASGLVVFRASRLEALLDPLLILLDSQLPDDVLAPQTVIAAHPGIKQWLSGAIARKRGAGGIVANLDIGLPSSWLDARAVEYLGASAIAIEPYRRDRLRWRIHACLDRLGDHDIESYLGGHAPALRRFQLADRLAGLFTQYLVYRPDWLRAWQSGDNAVPGAGFQPDLWRALRQDIALPHRGELLEALFNRILVSGASMPSDPLHVFGVNHLAPAELALLSAVARQRPVALYLLDPCIKYWAGLSEDIGHRRQLAGLAPFDDASEAAFFGQLSGDASSDPGCGHTLLARWGRMGQHFMLALNTLVDEPLADIRHCEDETPAAAESPSLLHWVQESVRRLDVGLADSLPTDALDADASLRIHLCHTRLRELEVLRNALLDAFASRPGLKPSQVVVMAPDISAYQPLLGAVFGTPGDPSAALPYHYADLSVARMHPLLTTFSRLLLLPQSRITAPEVIDLMRIPEVAAALAIDAAGVEVLARWLERTGVAWALDAEFRAGFGVPRLPEHSFAWGMERMLAGVVFGQTEDGRAVRVPQSGHEDGALWPVQGMQGPQVGLLGALDGLLQELAFLRRESVIPRPASAWTALLLDLVDRFFSVDRRDRDAREALAALREAVQALALETAEAGDPVLEFLVVSQVLQQRLDAVSERQPFLMGGITFCGMVPQRAIPFEVVAVLGLNDGEFPRQVRDDGLDLMLKPGNRRIGDRDQRNDDRYLFLETLMSARQRLHLSYIGEGVRDGKARNPAAPLADLLQVLDDAYGLADMRMDQDEIDAARAQDDATPVRLHRPWRIKHPLQPFDARYFRSDDPRLFSFDAGLAKVANGHEKPPRFRRSGGHQDMPTAATEAAPIMLKSLFAWFKDPAKETLSGVLRLRLDALEDSRLAAEEPIEAKFEGMDRIPRRLVLDALRAASDGAPTLPAQVPDWLRLGGKLPAGRPGQIAWAEAAADARKILASNPMPTPAEGGLRAMPQEVHLSFGGLRVEGVLQDVVTHDGGRTLWLLDVHAKAEDKLDFRARIPFFFQWALLRLVSSDDIAVRPGLLLADHPDKPKREWRDSIERWCARFDSEPASRVAMRAELAQRLQLLIDVYRQAQVQPVWYFPKASWAARGDGGAASVDSAWNGGFRPGERSYSPGYARLLARGLDLSAHGEELTALTELAHRLDRAISLADDDASPGVAA